MPLALSERTRLADPPDAALRELTSDEPEAGEPRSGEPMYDLIELFFFAYRDFVADADRLLEAHAFGRAHHRVLHFVTRQPGMTVADLLDILRITKQSLNRVMTELVESGCIEMCTAVADRRRRLLFPTARGRRLAHDLAATQSRRFERVLDQLPAGAREGARQFFLALIDGEAREAVRARLVPGVLPPRLVVAADRPS